MTLLKKVGLSVLAVFVALAGLLFYLQTRHGFRHAIVPLASTLTGAQVEVRDGLLSLTGSLEVDGLVYKDPVSGVSFDVERFMLRATPWSFLSEGVPKIDNLEVKKANLRIVAQAEPAVQQDEEAEDSQSETTRVVPVAVERARFEDVRVSLEQEDSRLTGHVDADLNQLGPDRAGNVTIQTGFLLERDGTQDLSGTVDLTLSVEIGPGGTPIQWTGSHHALLRTGLGSLEPADPEVVNFDQKLAGEYDRSEENLQASSNVTIRKAGEKLGTAELTVAMDGAKRPSVTDVSLTMGGITGDTLNLLLGGTGSIRMHAGRFDAHVKAHIEGPRTSVEGKVTGSGVRLRSREREASPPVDISLEQVGSFDSTANDVTIDTLTLSIDSRAKTLLSAALDRPVSLDLDRAERSVQSSDPPAEAAGFSLELVQSDIQELRPWLALAGNDPLKGIVSGKLGASLVVSIYGQGATIDVTGKIDSSGVMLQTDGRNRPAGLLGPLGIKSEWNSRLTGMKRLDLDPVTTTINLKGMQVGRIQATGSMRFADAAELTALDGALALTGLPGEALNPLLGLWSQTRIGRSQIDGHADIVVDQSRAKWEVDLRSQGMQLRLPDVKTASPPLDLLIKQDGEFDRKARTLRLDRLNVQVVERARPLVMLSLDQPLTLTLAQTAEGKDSKKDGSEEPITLGLQVNRLGIHQLRPWVALTGSQALAPVRGGALDADLKVRLKGTDDVAVTGRVDLKEISFVQEKNDPSAPITLDTELRASVIGRSHVTVDSWEVRAQDGKQLLARARLSGSADAAGATDLALDVSASDLSELAERFGLLTDRQQEMISGGSLKSDVRLTTAGPDNPLTMKGTLRSENLKIRLDKSHQMNRSLELQVEVDVDEARTVAELKDAEATVESEGVKTGTITVNGRWPLTSGESMPAGAVSVTVKEWDSGPFVDFFNVLPGRKPGPLPVSADFKIDQDAGGKTLSVQGKQTFGPIVVAVKGHDPEQATVHLEHDVARSGDDFQVKTLSLMAERSQGRTDRAAVSGSIRLGARPRLRLHGSVDALNADWYAALTASRPEKTQTDEASGKKPEVEDDQAGFAVPLDLDVALVIGTVTYRGLEIGKGRLVARGDGKSMQATLEPTGIAGGNVRGTVATALKDGRPEFEWDVKGNDMELGTILKAALDEPEPRVTGQARIATSGTGRGQGESLRKSLTGTVVFDVTDGQFVRSPVLEFLAEQTHIEDFKGLGFKTLHGELQIKDGWINIKQISADGPSVAVEASGRVGLDGRLDVEVQPKIGPAIADKVRIPCVDQFMKTVGGFTVLPVAVTVEGTAANPSYGVTVTPGSAVGKHAGALVGTIADLFTACQGGRAAQKATDEALGKFKDTAKEIIKDLFGGKKQQ